MDVVSNNFYSFHRLPVLYSYTMAGAAATFLWSEDKGYKRARPSRPTRADSLKWQELPTSPIVVGEKQSLIF